MIIWNPWHGCHKISEGCEHCYMYFLDRKRGIDTSKVYRTENFYKAIILKMNVKKFGLKSPLVSKPLSSSLYPYLQNGLGWLNRTY